MPPMWGASELLKSYNGEVASADSTSAPPNKKLGTADALQSIFEGRRVEESKQDPSFVHIPRFFFKKPSLSDPLQAKLRQAAQDRFLRNRQEELLVSQELAALQELFSTHSTPPTVDVALWQTGLNVAKQKIHVQLNEAEAEARRRGSGSIDDQSAENVLMVIPLIREGRFQEAERQIDQFPTKGSSADAETESTAQLMLSLTTKLQAISQRWQEIELVLVGSFMDYNLFTQLSSEVPPKAKKFFNARTFLKFPRDEFGRISSTSFLNYIQSYNALAETRIQLSRHDSKGKGYLREADLENYVYELIPTLAPLHSEEAAITKIFYPFYVFTAVRRFFFFLDPRRTGKVRIRDLLASRELTDLLALRDDAWSGNEEADNWFSPYHVKAVYNQYLELDADENGMLSRNELLRYGSTKAFLQDGRSPARLTSVFIDRVFQEYRTYPREGNEGRRGRGEGELDYKTFLDFTLAMENQTAPEAIMYFWRLLDIQKVGYLNIFAINYFFREIAEVLRESGQVKVEDVKDEIFDMVKPEDGIHITLDDLLRSGVAHTIINMIIDIDGFWAYDQRENIIHSEHEEEPEAEES